MRCMVLATNDLRHLHRRSSFSLPNACILPRDGFTSQWRVVAGAPMYCADLDGGGFPAASGIMLAACVPEITISLATSNSPARGAGTMSEAKS